MTGEDGSDGASCGMGSGDDGSRSRDGGCGVESNGEGRGVAVMKAVVAGGAEGISGVSTASLPGGVLVSVCRPSTLAPPSPSPPPFTLHHTYTPSSYSHTPIPYTHSGTFYTITLFHAFTHHTVPIH